LPHFGTVFAQLLGMQRNATKENNMVEINPEYLEELKFDYAEYLYNLDQESYRPTFEEWVNGWAN